jgi:hypothetical protein
MSNGSLSKLIHTDIPKSSQQSNARGHVKLSSYFSGFIYNQGKAGLQQGRKAVSLASPIYVEFSYPVQNNANG